MTHPRSLPRTGRNSANGVFTFRLPLPISKNRRVKTGARQVLKVDLVGKAYYTTKVIVRNTPEWKAYKTRVWEILIGEHHFHLKSIRPEDGEKLAFDCLWYVRNDRTDCVNFHDLLADAIQDAIDVDDRHFLIRDVWSYVDEEDPRVEIEMRRVSPPSRSR